MGMIAKGTQSLIEVLDPSEYFVGSVEPINDDYKGYQAVPPDNYTKFFIPGKVSHFSIHIILSC